MRQDFCLISKKGNLSFLFHIYILYTTNTESITKPTIIKLFGENMILTFKTLFAHSHFHQFIFPRYENNLNAWRQFPFIYYDELV